MVEKEFANTIDQEIRSTRKMLDEMPEAVRKRTVQLKAMPNEVISRIKQIDGVVIEFEER